MTLIVRARFNKSQKENTKLSVQQGILFFKTEKDSVRNPANKTFEKKTIILWMCDSVRFSPYDSIFFSTLRRSVHCSRREWKHHSHIQNDGVVSEVSGFSFVRLLSNTIQFSLKSSHITPFNNLNCLFIFVWWFFVHLCRKRFANPYESHKILPFFVIRLSLWWHIALDIELHSCYFRISFATRGFGFLSCDSLPLLFNALRIWEQ